jgi:hypothetical protein
MMRVSRSLQATLGGSSKPTQKGVKNMHTYFKSELEEMKDEPWIVVFGTPKSQRTIKYFSTSWFTMVWI